MQNGGIVHVAHRGFDDFGGISTSRRSRMRFEADVHQHRLAIAEKLLADFQAANGRPASIMEELEQWASQRRKTTP